MAKSRVPSKTQLEFICSVVNSPPEDCVLWPFKTDNNGYGTTMYQGKRQRAHRLALQIHTGESGDGLVAAHGPCHNPTCMNPLHLSWKTHKENSQDRRRDNTFFVGEDYPHAKLTNDIVEQICRSTEPVSVQAKKHGVCESTIYKIRRGDEWAHVSSGLPKPKLVERTRSRKSSDGRKKPIYTFTGDEKVMEQLIDYAMADDRTTSYMIRKAIEEYVAKLNRQKARKK